MVKRDGQTEPKKLLTIGGWDPCGAFGVPADLKTFSALRVHGMGVMTVLTAQNSVGWYGADFVSAEFVAKQLDAVLGDYGADGVKTGFLGRADLIKTIAQKLKQYEMQNIVVDPVLINANGRPMFGPEVQEAYETELFPLASAITPNRSELNWLLHGESLPWELNDGALNRLLAWVSTIDGDPAVVVKGLPEPDGGLVDWMVWQGERVSHSHERVATRNVSGTGDSFSAALTTWLARGERLPEAFKRASAGVARAIASSGDWQLGQGPGPINHDEFRTPG